MEEKFDGYRVGDITYCVPPKATTCFPVVVVSVGREFLDVQPLESKVSESVSPGFAAEESSRRFLYPHLPNMLVSAGATSASSILNESQA